MSEALLWPGFRALIRVEAVGVLVNSELVEGREVLVAYVAPILHAVFVALRVLEETVEFRERQTARRHDAHVHLAAEDTTNPRERTQTRSCACTCIIKWGRVVLSHSVAPVWIRM